MESFSSQSQGHRHALSALAVMACIVSLANAQDGAQQVEDAQGQTVVIATRHPDDPFEVSLSTEVVTEAELKERGSRTPAEALRYKPGIWVQKTGHLGGAPILRGFMGNQVVYLFDGIRRNTAGLFGGPNSFLQTIDALDVDRIEVVRGPGSVLYGSDAIGGVLNVISNEQPLFTDNGTMHGGRLYTRYASVDQEQSARLEGFHSSEDFYAFIGGTYRDIGDLEGGQGVGLQIPSSWREKNLDGQMNWRIDDQANVELFWQDFSRPKGTRYDRPNWKQADDREMLGLRFRAQELGAFDQVEVTGYFHDQRSFIDEMFFDSKGQDQTYGFEAQATTYASDDVRLVYGLHMHRDDIEKSNPQSGTVDPDVEWLNPAAYVLGEWQATDRLRLDLGLRWDQFNLQSTAPAFGELDPVIQNAITSGAFALEDLELDSTDDALTGGIGAVYAITDETNVVAHVGHAFRAPNKNDLLSFGQFTFGFNVPTPSVDSESSWTYELGLRTEKDDWAGAVTGFYTEVDNAIVSTPGTFNGSSFVDVNGNTVEDPGEAVYVKSNSTGTVRAVGFELEGRQYLPRSWKQPLVGANELSWYGNASWIYGEDTGSDEPLDRAYPANALIGLRLEEARLARDSGWWLELETWLVRHFDRIPSNRKTSDPAFFVDPQDPGSGLIGGDGGLPGFGIINLRGGKRIGEHSTLYLGLENLTDRAYRIKDSRIDAPGLNFMVALEISF